MASLFSLHFIKMPKVLALMVLFFLSSVQSASRTHFGVDEGKTWVKQDFESYGSFKSLGKGVSDLAREVPSGPDPLHHNIHPPTRP